MNSVDLIFKERAISRGGLLLYTNKIAQKYVEECFKHGIVILGIDGFHISNEYTQPSIDNSIDFSRMTNSNANYEEAIDFLKQSPDELYFEIICAE